MLVALPVAGVPLGEAAAGTSPRPAVEVGELRGPVTRPDGEVRWRLPVAAVDPDGSIVEVEVDWGDGSRLYLLTVCLGPGDPLTLHTTHAYERPGTYVVRARAISVDDCEAPAHLQRSPWAVAEVTATRS